jgi:predicted secreted protein
MDKAFGTLLQRGDGATPAENFATVAELANVEPALSKDEIEGTHHQSPGGWKQFKPGLKEGEISFEGNYLPTDPTHNASLGLLKDFADGSIRNYRVLFPIGGIKWTAPAFLREFNPAAPVEGKLGLSGTFRLAGEPTLE